MTFVPLLPWPVLAAMALVALAMLGIGGRGRGTALRAAGFAVLLAWLAGPTRVHETRQTLRDIALLVVDRSASMAVGDRTALAGRAAATIARQAAAFPDLELRTVTVPEAGHDGTRLWAAAEQALADIPPARLAGIVAITDGQVHDVPARPPGAPLHALIAARGEEFDRRVRVVSAPPYGIVGQDVTVRVVVEDLGPAPAATTATLTLRRDGGPAFALTVPLGQPQDIPLHIDRAGPTLLEFATDATPGEASALNNRAVVQIQGVRDRLRVLLVSGEPNLGERAWRQLLKSDPAVDLVHFTILRLPDKDDMTPLDQLALIAFPTRELFDEKLAKFDLIVLDRFADPGILPMAYLRNIADYVSQGGALLLTAGPEFVGPDSLDRTPLAGVLPAHAAAGGGGVVEGAFKPVVTALGQRHPVTAGLDTGWGPWYRAIATTAQGEVLLTGPGAAPLLVLDRVGNGRVAMLLSDQIWLWARGHQGGGPAAELLRRTAHWLMKEPDLDEDSLAATIAAQTGRLTVERHAAAAAAAGEVTITDPAGARTTLALAPVSPGVARGDMAAPAPGVWQASDGTHTVFAAAALGNALEYADLRATAEKLRPVAHGSGGGVAWLDPAGAPALRRVGADGAASGGGWIGLRRRGAYFATGATSGPLLPAWLALMLAMVFVGGAWARERR